VVRETVGVSKFPQALLCWWFPGLISTSLSDVKPSRATNSQNVCTPRNISTQLNSLVGHRNDGGSEKIGRIGMMGGTIVIHSDPERHRRVWVDG
jgi:hypothetical protein